MPNDPLSPAIEERVAKLREMIVGYWVKMGFPNWYEVVPPVRTDWLQRAGILGPTEAAHRVNLADTYVWGLNTDGTDPELQACSISAADEAAIIHIGISPYIVVVSGGPFAPVTPLVRTRAYEIAEACRSRLTFNRAAYDYRPWVRTVFRFAFAVPEVHTFFDRLLGHGSPAGGMFSSLKSAVGPLPSVHGAKLSLNYEKLGSSYRGVAELETGLPNNDQDVALGLDERQAIALLVTVELEDDLPEDGEPSPPAGVAARQSEERARQFACELLAYLPSLEAI